MTDSEQSNAEMHGPLDESSEENNADIESPAKESGTRRRNRSSRKNRRSTEPLPKKAKVGPALGSSSKSVPKSGSLSGNSDADDSLPDNGASGEGTWLKLGTVLLTILVFAIVAVSDHYLSEEASISFSSVTSSSFFHLVSLAFLVCLVALAILTFGIVMLLAVSASVAFLPFEKETLSSLNACAARWCMICVTLCSLKFMQLCWDGSLRLTWFQPLMVFICWVHYFDQLHNQNLETGPHKPISVVAWRYNPAFITDMLQGNNEVGHAAIDITGRLHEDLAKDERTRLEYKEADYVSWWPEESHESYQVDFVAEANLTADDETRHGVHADEIVRVGGLDTDNMRAEFRRRLDQPHHWHLFGPSCSTVSIDCLLAGGARAWHEVYRRNYRSIFQKPISYLSNSEYFMNLLLNESMWAAIRSRRYASAAFHLCSALLVLGKVDKVTKLAEKLGVSSPSPPKQLSDALDGHHEKIHRVALAWTPTDVLTFAKTSKSRASSMARATSFCLLAIILMQVAEKNFGVLQPFYEPVVWVTGRLHMRPDEVSALLKGLFMMIMEVVLAVLVSLGAGRLGREPMLMAKLSTLWNVVSDRNETRLIPRSSASTDQIGQENLATDGPAPSANHSAFSDVIEMLKSGAHLNTLSDFCRMILLQLVVTASHIFLSTLPSGMILPVVMCVTAAFVGWVTLRNRQSLTIAALRPIAIFRRVDSFLA